MFRCRLFAVCTANFAGEHTVFKFIAWSEQAHVFTVTADYQSVAGYRHKTQHRLSRERERERESTAEPSSKPQEIANRVHLAIKG